MRNETLHRTICISIYDAAHVKVNRGYVHTPKGLTGVGGQTVV